MYNSDSKDEQTKEVSIKSVEEKNKKSVVAGEEIILDDSRNEETIKDKKRLNKKILIGIICIISIVICVVIYAILNNNKSSEDIVDIEDESNLISSVTDTYEGLNYLSEKTIIKQTGFFYDYSRNLEGSKIEVSYIKVEGLKDNQLEENKGNL